MLVLLDTPSEETLARLLNFTASRQMQLRLGAKSDNPAMNVAGRASGNDDESVDTSAMTAYELLQYFADPATDYPMACWWRQQELMCVLDLSEHACFIDQSLVSGDLSVRDTRPRTAKVDPSDELDACRNLLDDIAAAFDTAEVDSLVAAALAPDAVAHSEEEVFARLCMSVVVLDRVGAVVGTLVPARMGYWREYIATSEVARKFASTVLKDAGRIPMDPLASLLEGRVAEIVRGGLELRDSQNGS